MLFFFFSSRRRHTRSKRDWSSDVCSSDLLDVGRPQHATLECRGSQVGGEGIDLLRDECGRECLPGNHGERVLRRYGSNGGRAEHAELMKLLEIVLNSCCSACVLACDRERYSRPFRGRVLA